jgi:hypothetical protein
MLIPEHRVRSKEWSGSDKAKNKKAENFAHGVLSMAMPQGSFSAYGESGV